MRVKHLLTLKQKKDQPSWLHIATYWLGKDIYNFNREFHHLKRNNITKTSTIPPLYYSDLIHCIKTQNLNIPNLQNKTKTIYKSILEKGTENHMYLEKKNGKMK